METWGLKDCPREKTDFQIVTENGVCQLKSCNEDYCQHYASQPKEKERENRR